MKTQSIDTHPKAEAIQILLIRKEGKLKKFSQIRLLSGTIIQLSKRAISRVNKNLDEQQINLLFIDYHYGKELAGRVQKYLMKGHHGST